MKIFMIMASILLIATASVALRRGKGRNWAMLLALGICLLILYVLLE
jgi:hypothetical protein